MRQRIELAQRKGAPDNRHAVVPGRTLPGDADLESRRPDFLAPPEGALGIDGKIGDGQGNVRKFQFQATRQALQIALKIEPLALRRRTQAKITRQAGEKPMELFRHEEAHLGGPFGEQRYEPAELDDVAKPLFGIDQDRAAGEVFARPMRGLGSRAGRGIVPHPPAVFVIAPRAHRHASERQFAHPAAEQGFGIIRQNRDCPLVACERVFGPLEVEQRNAAIVMGFGKIGFQDDGFVIAFERLFEPAKLLERVPAIVQGLGETGRERDSPIVALDRLAGAPEILEGNPAIVVGIGEIRVQGNCGVETRKRLIVAIQRQ